MENVVNRPLSPALSRERRWGKTHGAAAVIEIADVTFNEAEVSPLGCANEGLDLIKVALVAGAEVVEADDALVEFEQGFEQVAADEAGDAGD